MKKAGVDSVENSRQATASINADRESIDHGISFVDLPAHNRESRGYIRRSTLLHTPYTIYI